MSHEGSVHSRGFNGKEKIVSLKPLYLIGFWLFGLDVNSRSCKYLFSKHCL